MKKLLLLIVLLTNFLQVSIAAEATTQASPYQVIEVTGNKPVSYTHLTLPTIYSV